jgi:hypothetical protein
MNGEKVKEFLKKYGIFIAIGLVAVFFLLRKSKGAASAQSPLRTSAGAGRPTGSIPGPQTGIATRPATAVQPPVNRGGTGGGSEVAQYANIIFGSVNQFLNILDRINRQSGRARTPTTFPSGGRAGGSDRLIRIIDASGVETVIAPGGYDISPDFGIPGLMGNSSGSIVAPGDYDISPDFGVPADYWGTSDNGGTFLGDIYSGMPDISFEESGISFGEPTYPGDDIYSNEPNVSFDPADEYGSFDYLGFNPPGFPLGF